MSRYGSHFDTMPRMDTFYAHDMLFVLENFDESSFGVVERINPARQLEKANIILEVMKDGSIDYASEYRRRVENLRRWQRRNARNSVYAKNTGTGGKNAGASAQHGNTRNGGAATGKGRGADEVKPKRSTTDTNDGGKMSQEANTFLRHFTGEIKAEEFLYLSNVEKATIGSSVKSRKTYLSDNAKTGLVWAHDSTNTHAYLYECNEDDSITVTDILDATRDIAIIERITERMQNYGRTGASVRRNR